MTYLLLYLVYAVVLNIALARLGIPERAGAPAKPAHAVSKIVVVGATGGTGRAVVLQALERQYVVTALVRVRPRSTLFIPAFALCGATSSTMQR